jgi:hypothetical protein
MSPAHAVDLYRSKHAADKRQRDYSQPEGAEPGEHGGSKRKR